MTLTPAVAIGALLLVATATTARVALLASSEPAGRARRGHNSRPGHGAPSWLRSALASAAVDWPARLAWRCWLALVVIAAAVATAAAGPALGLVVTGLVLSAPVIALRAMAGRAGTRLERGLPDVLEATARSLRSGASLRGALAEASEVAPPELARDLTLVVQAATYGLGLTAALDDWATARPGPGVRLATAAIALGYETGSPARALDGVAATLRDRQALEREVRALSSQTRMSGVVIATAPIGFAAIAMGLDGATATFLLRTPAGLACLVTGLALDGVAAWWMTRITRSA